MSFDTPSQLYLPLLEDDVCEQKNDKKISIKCDPMGYKFRIIKRSKFGKNERLFPTKDHLENLHIKSLEEARFSNFKQCVEAAVKLGISLNGADLTNSLDAVDLLEINSKETNAKIKLYSLSGGDYTGGDFRNTYCVGVNFADSLLDYCNFSGDFTQRELDERDINGLTTEAERAVFSGCSLKNTQFNNAVLNHAEFNTSIGAHSDLIKATYCDLTNAKLTNTCLRFASFSSVKLGQFTQISVLDDRDIETAHFRNIDFSVMAFSSEAPQERAAFPFYMVRPSHYSNCTFPEGFNSLSQEQNKIQALKSPVCDNHTY